MLLPLSMPGDDVVLHEVVADEAAEDWLVLIANGRLRTDGFISGKPRHVVDHRVHLYGGPRRPRQR